MTTGPSLLPELAREYEEALTREDQLASLHRAVLGWTRVDAAELAWVGKKLREGEHLSFLSELSYSAPVPQEKLQDELLDFALPLLEKRGRCDGHLYEVLYCARVFFTTFRYFGKLLERAENCSAKQLKVIARLLDSEDKWGHRATVDNRLCFQKLLQRRVREEEDIGFQTAAALCAGPDANPTVSDPYLSWIQDLVRSMPKQLRAWWYPHLYGHGASLTGRIKGRLRLKEDSVDWLMTSLAHERFEFFATHLFQRSVRLAVPERYYAVLRKQYRKRRVSSSWCYFGDRTGNWKRWDWAKYLVRYTEETELTSLFLESPVSWLELGLMARHCWCEESFGEVNKYRKLLQILGARGLVFYKIAGEQIHWCGILGEPWVGPPLHKADFIGKDVVTTTTLSPFEKLQRATGLTEKSFLVCGVGHLRMEQDGSRGVFAYRPLHPDSTEKPSGAFSDQDFEEAQKWRDSTLGWETLS